MSSTTTSSLNLFKYCEISCQAALHLYTTTTETLGDSDWRGHGSYACTNNSVLNRSRPIRVDQCSRAIPRPAPARQAPGSPGGRGAPAGRPGKPAQHYIFKLGFQGWGFHKGFGVSAAGPDTYLYITVHVYNYMRTFLATRATNHSYRTYVVKADTNQVSTLRTTVVPT